MSEDAAAGGARARSGAAGARRAPTIIDVAKRAGVSKSLVSLVLRRPLVSEERKALVLEVMAELGYRPNGVARRLVQRRTGLVGVMASDLRNPFFAELAESVDAQAVHRGYRAVLAAGHRDARREQLVVNDFLESRVEAIVLLSPTLSAAAINRAAGLVPVVVEGRPSLRSTRVALVSADDVLGADIAVSHLASLGHRAIAHISGTTAVARRDGYERSMRLHELDDQVEIHECDETDTGGYEAALRLLDRPNRPTAIFAVNDVVALSVLAAADDLSITVPQDLSVVGFDDTYLAGLRGVGLTSVAQPSSELAAAVVAAFANRLAVSGNSKRAVRRWLAPRLVVRRTRTRVRAT